MTELNRRDFVVAAVGAVCAGCLCEFAEGADAPGGQMKGTLDVGTKADYAKDGAISDKFAKSDRVIVAREDGKIYAMNATCTHRSAIVTIKGEDLFCPKHGSKFSHMGTPTKGPAKSSLTRFAIKEDDKGHLIVDKSKQFEEKHWDDDGASVKA